MAKISRRKFSEILKTTILQKPYRKISNGFRFLRDEHSFKKFREILFKSLQTYSLHVVHSTLWKLSTWWKFGLYFVYIFIANWNFLNKFCSSHLILNRNILIFLYSKSETLAHAQLCNQSFLHTI